MSNFIYSININLICFVCHSTICRHLVPVWGPSPRGWKNETVRRAGLHWSQWPWLSHTPTPIRMLSNTFAYRSAQPELEYIFSLNRFRKHTMDSHLLVSWIWVYTSQCMGLEHIKMTFLWYLYLAMNVCI